LKAFAVVGIGIKFEGVGNKEKGVVVKSDNPDFVVNPGQVVVEIDPHYFRPSEVDYLIGDASKAKEKLGWSPRYTLDALIREMVEADLENFRRDVHLAQGGYHVPRSKE